MKLFKMFGGIALVSFTTIGAGILALPTNTYKGGFWPTSFSFLVTWLFMTVAAMLILKISINSDEGTDLVSMAKNTLGIPGKIIAWATYLFLVYALICAYLTASSAWLSKIFLTNFDINLSMPLAVTYVSTVTAIIIMFGTICTDLFNRFFSLGLLITYCVIIGLAWPHVNPEIIKVESISSVPNTIPLVLTTFGFGIVIPSLADYFQRDEGKLKMVIIVGSIIPLIAYLLWEFICLGTLSISGKMGLAELAKISANSTEVAIAMESIIGNKHISITANLFSVCAIITSLLGVSLSLYHFLADGFSMKKQGINKLILAILTFIPPVLIVIFYPSGFDTILSFGGIFVAVLLGLLPIAMYWKYSNSYMTKSFLSIASLFFIYAVGQQFYNILN